MIISSYGQSANDKASAARFNDCKGVDSSESKVQSIPNRKIAWRMNHPRFLTQGSYPKNKYFG